MTPEDQELIDEMYVAAGTARITDWLWNEFDHAQHEWDALPENARPFYVPPTA